MTEKKYFDLEEANDLIPTLEYKLPQLMRIKKEITILSTALVDKGIDIKTLFSPASLLDADLINKKESLEKLALKLNQGLEEIENLGCLIKDLELGLVDFYGLLEGQEVFFCWQLGEPSLNYWHEVDQGFSNRKALNIEEENLKKYIH